MRRVSRIFTNNSLHRLRLLRLAPRVQQNCKAAMREIPWNAKPTLSSASVISETLYADKIDYFFLAAGFFFLASGFFFLTAFLCFFSCFFHEKFAVPSFLCPGGVRA